MYEIAKKLVQLASKKDKTIGSCESLTAGLFTSTIASVSGASAVLKGGLVTYFSEMKVKLAHVDKEIVDKYGVISKECAEQMAVRTRNQMNVDYCVSFTGNAGPSSIEEKPAGRVYCCIATRYKTYDYEFQIDNKSRNEVRSIVVETMMEEIIYLLEKE